MPHCPRRFGRAKIFQTRKFCCRTSKASANRSCLPPWCLKSSLKAQTSPLNVNQGWFRCSRVRFPARPWCPGKNRVIRSLPNLRSICMRLWAMRAHGCGVGSICFPPIKAICAQTRAKRRPCGRNIRKLQTVKNLPVSLGTVQPNNSDQRSRCLRSCSHHYLNAPTSSG